MDNTIEKTFECEAPSPNSTIQELEEFVKELVKNKKLGGERFDLAARYCMDLLKLHPENEYAKAYLMSYAE